MGPALKFILFWAYSMKNGYDWINFLSLSLSLFWKCIYLPESFMVHLSCASEDEAEFSM